MSSSNPRRRTASRGAALLLGAACAAGAAGAAVADGAAESMRAAVVAGARVGVQRLPRPVPAAGEVLVRLRFAGVNPADWKYAAGLPGADAETGPTGARLAEVAPSQAAIPGLEGAGVIAALGADVRGYRVGEPVLLWSARRGTYAQFAAVPVATLARKPSRLSFAQAAALAHAGLAAWAMLVDQAHVRAGERVLVLGGAGGVGSAAVQIAHNLGAHVSATASARNLEYLRSLGAEQVIDHTTRHFEDQARDIDVVVNTVDADNAFRGLSVLKPGGFLLSVSGLPPPDLCALRNVNCSMRRFDGTPAAMVLRRLADWSQAGRYGVNVDRVFRLEEVVKAWGYSQNGHTRGKSVIQID